MDLNQTAGTTPSRVNDIDPIGSDSGTEVTPTGLTHYRKYRGIVHRKRRRPEERSLASLLLLSLEILESAPHRLQSSSAITRRRSQLLTVSELHRDQASSSFSAVIVGLQPEFEDGFNENAEEASKSSTNHTGALEFDGHTHRREQQEYQHITCNIAASEHEITQANSLSEDFIQYVEAEVVRLDEVENLL
ncbi:hypothetical protein F2Q68_00021650 [Brassica cretica]|uniref:Uncharacterized protein n=1 Tax=Brassica cretica TaxID=69181 RepID=A0A8S9G2B4_BRACR|nr:hypothetical protein F2Q68_00021650 [Brassica cretica]